ncbi:hypothetical protein BOW35_12570 [Solemya velum gill symbiont]|nr:cache domain-containing protein [Solemya velum gill symbiont]OOZ12424.1 hypothetical protein BOW27_11530 [Solemya velum gill symbiont]OOZ17100.1 hypothetical protein BOW29_11560 [Solemya velum gill symbiont]OOZ20381.1 hypothetical protein BOW30_12355 [Solemya velum gill symbiont]OOZ21637.1 hypothetical protein BOW31_12430 [Solemya velum gill symbiont]OOZ26684.1 hypothetical protein BOW33_12545 [Solemya velum gill symbiont]
MIDSIRNLGLRNRVFLTILGIILLVGSLLYFKVQYDQRQALHNSYLSIAQNALDNRSQHLIIRIENLRNQTRFLSQTPPVQAIARAIKNNGFDQLEGNSRSIWEQRLKDIFKAFLQANPFYFQLRYIGVADNGKELIRVDYKNDQIITATGEQLQSKGDEKYFIETLKMSEGEIYISDVTLNREFGVVQLPHVRTIRASVPVFTPDGELFGMVVANMDIGPVFDLVMSQIRPGIKGYVSNQEGDFLVHPYPEKTFGFDLGKRYR